MGVSRLKKWATQLREVREHKHGLEMNVGMGVSIVSYMFKVLVQ